MGSVRVAIVGVGNCATSLIQGVRVLQGRRPRRHRPRAHARQVRRLPRQRRRVRRGVRRRRQEGRQGPLRGHQRLREQHHQDRRRPDRSASRCSAARPSTASASTTARPSRSPTPSRSTSSQVLKDTKADVLVSYLPVGSEEADKFYAQCAIDAGVGLRQRAAGLHRLRPRCGPRSSRTPASRSSATTSSRQVGATITHRVMAKLFEDRGVALDRTYQLNVGGNMDFKNMLERERLESKKVSKTQAVTSNLTGELADKINDRNVHIGPSDYVAVARRPQVGLRPPRGSRVRRRPAQPRVQARGLGLPQLRRHHHRRDPRREDRQGPRHRRPDHLARRRTS